MRRGAKELQQSSTKIQVTSNVTITEENEKQYVRLQLKYTKDPRDIFR